MRILLGASLSLALLMLTLADRLSARRANQLVGVHVPGPCPGDWAHRLAMGGC